MFRFATVPLACLVVSCGPAGNDPGPGGVTVDEARALDDAAEMLEQRRLPDAVVTGDPAGAYPAETSDAE